MAQTIFKNIRLAHNFVLFFMKWLCNHRFIVQNEYYFAQIFREKTKINLTKKWSTGIQVKTSQIFHLVTNIPFYSVYMYINIQSLWTKFFYRYYLGSAVCGCVCVCMYVFAITATPFKLELSNFGITFLMWISKNGFLKFSKKCFLQSYRPFSIFL